MNKKIFAYIPVLHQGYVNFLQKHVDANLFLLDRSITDHWRPLQKDIRALSVEQIKVSIEALGLVKNVKVISASDLAKLNLPSHTQIIVPDEQIMHEITEHYFSQCKVIFKNVFLRWDAVKSTSEQKVNEDEEVTQEKFHQQMMAKANILAKKSADWWRQIGAIIVKDGQILLEGYNHHVPNEEQPYIDGDPRADFHKGDHIEISTAFHAEASLIAQAARQGISLTGASMYVTTFPCPNCAKLIAYSGIKEVYFQQGYAMLDGESILRSQNVKITRVV